MKSTGPGTRFSVAAIIVAGILMIAAITFLVAVYRQVHETRLAIREEFAGWVNISAPIKSPFEYEWGSTIILGESRIPRLLPSASDPPECLVHVQMRL